MEIKYSPVIIECERKLTSLDKFVTDFTEILNKLKLNYVLVSGYVAILFGRSRSSEDIDLITEKLDFPAFNNLWTILNKKYECITTSKVKQAYYDYLLTKHAIRFSKKKEYIPNIELKFPKVELEQWALKNRKKASLNRQIIFISPIELQIPFKLFLGSEKDIEDAKHLYNIFKDNINIEILMKFNQKLKIQELFDEYLR